MAQDTAESSLMTLTERGQNQLKDEATMCKNILLTQKGLLKGNVTRFKSSIRKFHLLEENGLSTKHFSLEIGSAYDKLRADLEVLVEKWAQFIRVAVIAKDPQPSTAAEREILKREINHENEKIDEYREIIDELKLENQDVFRKVEDNSKSFQELQGHIKENRLKSELRPTPLTIDTTFLEVKTYIRNFSNYIQSGNDLAMKMILTAITG